MEKSWNCVLVFLVEPWVRLKVVGNLNIHALLNTSLNQPKVLPYVFCKEGGHIAFGVDPVGVSIVIHLCTCV